MVIIVLPYIQSSIDSFLVVVEKEVSEVQVQETTARGGGSNLLLHLKNGIYKI